MSFSETIIIEDIPVKGFQDIDSLFQQLLDEIRKPAQSLVYYLNVHVANEAYKNPKLKTVLKDGNIVYCDGAGIVLASKLQGKPLPTRLTAADWFVDLMAFFASNNCKVFLLGGEPGVAEKAFEVISRNVINHTIVGFHHGYIANNKTAEKNLIKQINSLNPDVLIVGFGTPLQELWIEEHRNELNVGMIYAIGAVMDYLSGKVARCPDWMGKIGMEWFFRLYNEPVRLFKRYIMGNPWFISRICFSLIKENLIMHRTKELIPSR